MDYEKLIKEKDAALSGMKASNKKLSQEIANAKKTIERDEALRTEYYREIAELKAEIDRLKPFEKHVLERKKWAEEFHKKYD